MNTFHQQLTLMVGLITLPNDGKKAFLRNEAIESLVVKPVNLESIDFNLGSQQITCHAHHGIYYWGIICYPTKILNCCVFVHFYLVMFGFLTIYTNQQIYQLSLFL